MTASFASSGPVVENGPAAMPARIAVAGHALLRQGLVMLMRRAHPDWSFREAANFGEARALLAEAAADLLLIDLRIPGMTRGESLRALRDVRPDLPIAALTAAEDRAAVLECLRAGVQGYILRSDPAETMLGAIETLLAGGAHVPPAIARAADAGVPAEAEPASPQPRIHPPPTSLTPTSLTPRQSDVLKLLAEGRSTKDIARRLDLGLGTVKVHLAGIYRALGAANRIEAVDRAGRLKLAEQTAKIPTIVGLAS